MELTGMTANVNAGALLKEAGMTVLIGIVVVFSVLVLLTVIFKLFGVVAGMLSKKETAAPAAPVAQPQPAVPAVKLQPVSSVPAVQAGIPGEEVAVVAAAVAAMSEAHGKTYAVRRISRITEQGVANNTRM